VKACMRCGLGLLALLICFSSPSQAQNLTSWTTGPGRLGLGYPVPIPVDTPTPFAGFRSYQGLMTRHFDLANRHDFNSREQIGITESGQRNIYMYVISDADALTIDHREEGSILINGGIHAREWQSPEVVTGLLELLAERSTDEHLYQYLIENLNVALIPVLNVDGFIQTQRTPAQNYLDSDPDFPLSSPRDGRMRRKNMRQADELLGTVFDHLSGVDLNRNNPPFHASSASSSFNPDNLIYHGQNGFSEAETLALATAPDLLLPGSSALTLGDRLRMFVDVHSFTRALFPVNTSNTARNQNQSRLMRVLVDHHRNLPGNKVYSISSGGNPNFGIGTTSEYFANQFQVPSWTLELEPGNGAGTEYGGFGSNGHDGFILPESEITRVRENMAASLAAAAYWTTGPPSLQSLRIIDVETGALLYTVRNDLQPGAEAGARSLLSLTPGALQTNHSYDVELVFDKPMRWLDQQNQIIALPGQSDAALALTLQLLSAAGQPASVIDLQQDSAQWALQRGYYGAGYANYKTDSVTLGITIPASANNQQLFNGDDPLQVQLVISDMSGHALDRDPGSAVDWQNGDWQRYQPSAASVAGVAIPIRPDPNDDQSFAVTGNMAGTWGSQENSGIGFVIQPLADGRVVIAWATFDEQGGQRWLVGVGTQTGNRIVADNMVLARGTSFQDFNPDDVMRTAFAGSLEFVFANCDTGFVQFHGFGQTGVRTDLVNSSRVAGSGCQDQTAELPALAHVSGAWFDPQRDGEGMTIHILPDGRALMFWYSDNNDGEQIWFVGVGLIDQATGSIQFEVLNQTSGARFGNDFNPADVLRRNAGQASFTPLCNDGVFDYSFTDPELGSGTLQLVRLTRIVGVPTCTQ
jgi:murein tripeptide amidase MpaA